VQDLVSEVFRFLADPLGPQILHRLTTRCRLAANDNTSGSGIEFPDHPRVRKQSRPQADFEPFVLRVPSSAFDKLWWVPLSSLFPALSPSGQVGVDLFRMCA
jgi:hypothetical protein